ncbi:NAD(P)-dependent oxidoreductase [Fulvimarina endophytica]|uniref:NAD(P)-dependent oxidoreductase n=1 Tax=Fulvimarina endophytica TaxID=2293836 RepID=A0A371WZ08_9HYPH|nr:NAD(P)-dependent oxidoreductase [Fulvimarina endophytica]RFC62220.1 NAD(P)-dependent oxidoreductase [Fulvimarina endophytica]
MTKRTVGMIGVGMMGHGIAANLVAKGWPLHYLDHAGNQPTEDLDSVGARRESDAASLVAKIDVLILCVTGSREIRTILLGDDELVRRLKPGTVVVDCSTGIPSETRTVAGHVEAAGCRFVDAAMTRTPAEAEAGRLNLLIGGDADVVRDLTPILEAFSENRFHAGPIGAGQTLKLLHNYVSLGTAVVVAEAAACAAETGIAPEVLVDCLKRGGGYGAALDRIGPYILSQDVSAMRFSNANARKDVAYYQSLVAETGTSHEAAKGILSALDWLNDNGYGGAMMPESCDAFRNRKGRSS